MSSNPKKSIIDIAREFKEMEVRNNLFQQQTRDGIYYWDIIRYHVYMTILSKYGVFESVQSYWAKEKLSESAIKRALKFIRLLPLYFINELKFISRRKKNNLYAFLFVSRFEDRNGNPEDLLMKDIYDSLSSDAFVMEYFRHKAFSWFKGNTGKRYFLYKLELSYLKYKKLEENWEKIDSIINKEFGFKLELEHLYEYLLSRYRKEYRFFSQVFKRVDPKFLFFQSAFPKGMVAAANDLGIYTIDLQHGHTNNTGVLYSYPQGIGLTHVSSIPRCFLTLGEFWNHLIDFPFKKMTCGNSYFYVEPNKYTRKNNGVLVVSVAFTHEFLKHATADLARCHPNKVFYYKLHSNQLHQISECKKYFKGLSNVIVVYTEKSVNDLMENCFAVIVIQSTVAYQALQKGLCVFIFKKDYYEISYDIFNVDRVFLVEDWKGISQNLIKLRSDENYSGIIFFEQYRPEIINKIISIPA